MESAHGLSSRKRRSFLFRCNINEINVTPHEERKRETDREEEKEGNNKNGSDGGIYANADMTRNKGWDARTVLSFESAGR